MTILIYGAAFFSLSTLGLFATTVLWFAWNAETVMLVGETDGYTLYWRKDQ